MTAPYSPGVRAILKCKAAADAIEQLDLKHWGGMVCWILEALDESLTEADTRDLLESIKQDIDTRITKGRW